MIRFATEFSIIEAPCAYKPDGSVARTYHALTMHGVNVVYCDTRDEAERALAKLSKLATELSR